MGTFEPVIGIREQLQILTSLLWVNWHYQAAFTISRTGRTDILEYYWYTKDHAAGIKTERLYQVSGEHIIIDFESKLYKIIKLGIDKKSAKFRALLQLESLEECPEHKGFVGEPVKRK